MSRLALMTGATGRIGKAIATGLAAEKDMELIIAGRSRERCLAAVEEIKAASGNTRISYDLCDVSRKISVDALYASLADGLPGGKTIDILINDAAVTPRERRITPEGLELQWATNVMGYYWMIDILMPLLAADAKIINVASYFAGGLDLTDPMFEKRNYSNNSAYRASKQADRMLTAGFARKYPEKSIIACHPGDVHSPLSTNLGYGGSETPQQGAATPLYAALSPDTDGQNGGYIEHRRITPCPYMENTKEVEELMNLCRNLTS